jgi:hypothetical protein
MLVACQGCEYFHLAAVGHGMKKGKGANIIVIGSKIAIEDYPYVFRKGWFRFATQYQCEAQ